MRLHHRNNERRRSSVAINNDHMNFLSVNVDPTTLRRHSLNELRPEEGALAGMQIRRNSSANNLSPCGSRSPESGGVVGGSITPTTPSPSPLILAARRRSALLEKKPPPLRRFDTNSSLEVSQYKIFSVIMIIVLVIATMGAVSYFLRKSLRSEL